MFHNSISKQIVLCRLCSGEGSKCWLVFLRVYEPSVLCFFLIEKTGEIYQVSFSGLYLLEI